MTALALGVNGNPGAPLPPDHAGRFETTLLAAYHPTRVDLSLLPTARPEEAQEDPFGPGRHDATHSLHGIFGADPSAYPPNDAPVLRQAMARWLADQAGTI